MIQIPVSAQQCIPLTCIDIIFGRTDDKKQYPVLQYKTAFVWVLLAGLVSITGLVRAIVKVNDKKGYGFLLGLTGVIALLMLQVSLNNFYKNIAVQYTWAYWLMLASFSLAGTISFLKRQNQNNNTIQATNNGNKPLNINIITTLAKTGKRKKSPTPRNDEK
jgi:lipopolysaccharide export LptBFGC system permease protein LptF